MAASVPPFPLTAPVLVIPCTGTGSTPQQLPVHGRGPRTIRICNPNAGWAYVCLTASPQIVAAPTATTKAAAAAAVPSVPVAPNSERVFSAGLDVSQAYLSAMLATGSGNIQVQVGDGA